MGELGEGGGGGGRKGESKLDDCRCLHREEQKMGH